MFVHHIKDIVVMKIMRKTACAKIPVGAKVIWILSRSNLCYMHLKS